MEENRLNSQFLIYKLKTIRLIEKDAIEHLLNNDLHPDKFAIDKVFLLHLRLSLKRSYVVNALHLRFSKGRDMN